MSKEIPYNSLIINNFFINWLELFYEPKPKKIAL